MGNIYLKSLPKTYKVALGLLNAKLYIAEVGFDAWKHVDMFDMRMIFSRKRRARLCTG